MSVTVLLPENPFRESHDLLQITTEIVPHFPHFLPDFD
jgi:hypothetical protein